MKTRINDETLNAFIDGELDEQQSRELQELLFADPLLRERVNELQNVKSLFRNSFGNPPGNTWREQADPEPQSRRTGLLPRAIAASLLVVLSFALGWQMKSESVSGFDTTIQHSTLAALDSMVSLPANPSQTGSSIKAVVRVSDADHNKAIAILKKLDRVLGHARSNQHNLRVELVAHAKGLDLLRKDTSSVATEIQHLLERHNNIVIAACNKTMERLRLETGIQAELLPDITIVPSALDQILMRLQDDWTYIQI